MADVVYTGNTYRLRAGRPMPMSDGNFYLHSFMAEINVIKAYAYTNTLPASTEFRGQGGTLISASFARLEECGGNSFTGKTVSIPIFIDEDDIAGGKFWS